MMHTAGWSALSPDARLLVYVLRDFHDQGIPAVEQTKVLAAAGLTLPSAKKPACEARDAGFIEKIETGEIRLTALVCMETALTTRPTRRTVKDESKLPSGFLRLWQIWPRGDSQAAAIKEFLKLDPTTDFVDMMVGSAAQQIALWAREGRERSMVPHLRTWISQKRWRDEIKTGPVGTPMTARERHTDAAAEEALRRRGFGT